MSQSYLMKAANTPRKVLARMNSGEIVWIELDRAITNDEARKLEAENDFRFFENCTEDEQKEMTQLLIEEIEARRDPNPHL